MYLNCHTHYSLRYGCMSEEALLQLAQQNACACMALTDINNTSACLNFARIAMRYGVRPILGIDFRRGIEQLYVGIAKNNEGFAALNSYLSDYLHAKRPLPLDAPPMENVYFIYPLNQLLERDKTTFMENEYIGVSVADLKKIRFSKYYAYPDKLVLLQTVSFRNKKDFNTHRLLRAIDNNTLLSKLPIEAQAQISDQMHPMQEIYALLQDFPNISANTENLMAECEIYFDFSSNKKTQNKSLYSQSEEKDYELIKFLIKKGIKWRFGQASVEIKTRIQKELQLIRQMHFISFFLINWDIVEYAKSKGYFHVGRGSGANSLIAYLLGITDVDPMELNLYFERFMNLFRTSPPDFDIDFSWRDRQDVTRYIFERYSEHNQVALIATYNTFKYKAAVREMGKVFGLPKADIDFLSREKFQYEDLDQIQQYVIRYAQAIQGMPNLLSVHAGGILISEKPIHYFSATFLPPKGFPTTQFDMVVAEDVGLYKYDILGQRGLAKIKECMSIIEYNQPNHKPFDIHATAQFICDPKVNATIRQADCMGCFYIESPAMRMLLSKLKVDNYLGLVAASSIIRPGVAKSGMMREYILRHKNPARRKNGHPVLLEILEDTYGVMVYQEDVIKVAHHFAGLSLGEADVLRRGMSGKYRSREEFQKIQHKFIANCKQKGYPDDLIQTVWMQIESFAGYAFAKGHSASYAVESYQTLYLKTYYPIEYMVSVLNNGGGFYRPETYVHEIRRAGGIVHAPCIMKSKMENIVCGKEVYLGFMHIHELQERSVEKILHARAAGFTYDSLESFIEQVPLSIDQLDLLIRIDAFRSFGQDKRSLLWKAHLATNKGKQQEVLQLRMFKAPVKSFQLPQFENDLSLDAFDQIELLGFPLCNPFMLLEKPIRHSIKAADLKNHINQVIEIPAYMVTIKRTKTSNGKRMYFGTFLDMEGDWIDTVHFPPVAAKYPFRGRGIYMLQARVVEEFNFISLEIIRQWRLAFIADPRYAD